MLEGENSTAIKKRFRAIRDQAKFERLAEFIRALPRIRRHVSRDLRQPGISREKVLASMVRLLETTFIRIGNEEYAKQNGSFGLTTLKNRHADVHGAEIQFCFRGKSGKQQLLQIADKRLARVVKRCQELPGQDLFEYINAEGKPQSVTSSDVNDYLKQISGKDFTAKDFRTWAGSLLAVEYLAHAKCGRLTRHAVVAMAKVVAARLGNTPAVCRKAYIHPALMEATAVTLFTKTTPGSSHAQEAALFAFLRRGTR